MQFYLTHNQTENLQIWKKQFSKVNCGAIGGGFTYYFLVENGVVIDKFVEFFKGGIWRPNNTIEDLSTVEMNFEITESQMARANAWINTQQLSIVTYRFIPTTMGTTFCVASKDGRKIDLSDYDNWG
jgi:hypothetical protein